MLCLCWPPGGALAQITSALFPCLKTWTGQLHFTYLLQLYRSCSEYCKLIRYCIPLHMTVFSFAFEMFVMLFGGQWCLLVWCFTKPFWAEQYICKAYCPCHLVDLVYYSSTVKLGWPLIKGWPLYAEGEVSSINQYFHLLNGRYKWSSLHAKWRAKYTQIKTRYPQDILEKIQIVVARLGKVSWTKDLMDIHSPAT